MGVTIEKGLKVEGEMKRGTAQELPALREIGRPGNTQLNVENTAPDLSNTFLFSEFKPQHNQSIVTERRTAVDPAHILGSLYEVKGKIANNDGELIVADLSQQDPSLCDSVSILSSGEAVHLTADDLRSLMRYGSRRLSSTE